MSHEESCRCGKRGCGTTSTTVDTIVVYLLLSQNPNIAMQTLFQLRLSTSCVYPAPHKQQAPACNQIPWIPAAFIPDLEHECISTSVKTPNQSCRSLPSLSAGTATLVVGGGAGFV